MRWGRWRAAPLAPDESIFLLSMLLLKIPTLEPSPTWSELLTTHVPSWTCRCRSTMDLQLFIYTLLPPRRSALHPNHDANTIVQIPGGTAPRGTKSTLTRLPAAWRFRNSPSSISVFSWWKNLSSGMIAHFVIIWQLISNNRLIMFKRFISYELVKLYN